MHFSDFDQCHVEQRDNDEVADSKVDIHYDIVVSNGFVVGYSTAEKIIEGQVDGPDNDFTPVTNTVSERNKAHLNNLFCTWLIIVALIDMEALDKVIKLREQECIVRKVAPLATCDPAKDSGNDSSTHDEPYDRLNWI